MQDYISRLIVPITENNIYLYNKSGALMVKGYTRIVIGERGPYVESTLNQIETANFKIPDSCKWRTNSAVSFYIEYRSTDDANVKLYYQLKTVDYADYKVGLFYISPFELYTQDKTVLISPLRRKK